MQLGRGTVEQIAVSPNGLWLAAVGNQGARLYSAQTLQLARALENKGRPITFVSWSPDSQQIVAAGDEKAARIWDANTGKLTYTLPLPADEKLHDVAWSPDGARLAVSMRQPGQNGIVLIWDAVSGQELLQYGVSPDGLAWSPDATRLAFYQGPSVSVANLDSPQEKPMYLLGAVTGPVNSVSWSPDGMQLAAGTGEFDPLNPPDYKVRVWDLATGVRGGTVRYVFEAAQPVDSVAWSLDGSTLAAGISNGEIQTWDMTTGQPASQLTGHGIGAVSVAWMPDNIHLVSAGSDGTVRQWDVARNIQTRSASDESISPPLTRQVAWSPDGTLLAFAGQDGTVRLWDAHTWQQFALLKGHYGRVNSVAWSPDGGTLASGGEDGFLRLWDVDTNQLILKITNKNNLRDYISHISWRPSAEYEIAVSGYPLQVWYPDGRLAFEGDQNGRSIVRAAWSPNGVYLAVAPRGLGSWVYSTHSGMQLLGESYYNRTTNDMVWSQDNQHLLVGTGFGKTGIVYLWDITTQSRPPTFEGQIAEVTSVAWSPNGKWWALGDAEGSVQIWDASNGQTMRVLEGHTGPITSVAWSPDSQVLVSSSEDGTVRVWGVPSQ